MLKETNLCLYASVSAIRHWAEIWQTEAGITPQTCTTRREPRYSSITTSAQRSTSNTEAYRQKSTPYPTPQPKNSKQPRHNVSHPTPKHTDKSQHRTPHHNSRTPKKSPRGVQRGRGFTAPLRFSTASQSKKTRPSAKQESKNKTKNQPHNKQRKRKSQRKIKKKNKRKNKGEKAWKIWNSFSTS